MNYKILLVDDEDDILEFMGYNLRKQGWEVLVAHDGCQAVAMALEHHPHLVLLDVMMPVMDGMQTCIELRSKDELRGLKIAMLTARGEDYSQIAGFDAGADDYITKPIRPAVLVSRIKALLKRFNADTQTPDTVATIKIDRERYLAIIRGQEISLPRKEFELLALLLSREERVFSREEIFDKVWGDDVVVGERTIDVHIRKLREKIGAEHILTIKGVGYKFTTKEG
ncbi:MAG: response regulator transcription factor [Mucinivorans sp.]